MGNNDLSPELSLLEKLKALQFRLAQAILFSWIRPTILDCDAQYLDIKSGDLVCYVMPFRSTTDLLVIDRACKDNSLPRPVEPMDQVESRAFFFLGHPEGRFGRKTLRQQSARMLRLFELQRRPDVDIKIVPISLFWGHQPDQEKSIFKLILSENWSVTSHFKKLLALIFHPNHILVQFSKPISLATLTSGEADPEKQKRKLHRLLRVHFTRQRQAIIGPDLSHRRTLINSIMTSPLVTRAIDSEVKNEGKTRHQIEKKALAYAREIASHQSYRVVRFFRVLLKWLWLRLYDGIEVIHIETAKQLARSHEIIYVPCHRSHIDYLLLSYVLYENGLTPPHIAAGKNLNLPIVGPLLRRGGAFFMRRTFQGDPLYKAIFDEYVHLMFTRGYSLEYFIEGSRSRTGRMLTPRTGMLSMTMRSFLRDSTKPIVFLPVYFGYERILEATTYIGELTGHAKTDESIFDILGIFRTFKLAFGKVIVSFGQPLELDKFLSEQLPGWDTHTENPDDFSSACRILSERLAIRINNAATLNPINLAATAILCTPRQTIELNRLKSQIHVLSVLARNAAIHDVYVTNMSPDQVVSQAEKVAGLHRTTQGFGDILSAPPATAILLTYYRNATLHLFVLASLIARIVRMEVCVGTELIFETCRVLHPYLKAELFLNWQSEESQTQCQQTLTVMASLGLVSLTDAEVLAPPTTTDEYASLTDLAEIIEPTLERFFVVAAILQDDQPQSTEQLENSASAIAQQLSVIYGINSPEFFEKSLFSRFIETLNHEGCIDTSDGKIISTEKFEIVKHNIEHYLDNDIRYNVTQTISHASD